MATGRSRRPRWPRRSGRCPRFALIPLILSDTLGKPIGRGAVADWVISGISILDSVRAALIAAIVATLIAVIARVVLHPGWAAVLLVVALVGGRSRRATPGTRRSRATTTSPSTPWSSTWSGSACGSAGLVAFLGLARQHVTHLPVIARRYSTIALVGVHRGRAVRVRQCLGADHLRLPTCGQTDYGRLVLLKAGLLTALGVIGYLHRKRTLPAITDGGDRRPLIRLAVVEVGIMAATIGVASALARTATPPPSGAAPTDTELVLGYDVDGPPTLLRLITDWRFDWILGVAAIAAAVLYLVGRPTAASTRRPLAAGSDGRLGDRLRCSCVIATSSGLGRYAEAQFSIHMMAHMMLGMIAPILLVLGGPVTLALRALPAAGRGDVPGLREAIVGALHSRPARFITHPLVVFPLFVLSFYVAVFLLAVRGDDRLAPRSPGDEPAFPARRLPVLLGDHRCRPVAAAGAADDQAGDADRRVAVPRVLRAGVDELAHGDGRRLLQQPGACPG